MCVGVCICRSVCADVCEGVGVCVVHVYLSVWEVYVHL